MTPSEVLRAARERIAAPERWTTLMRARDASGNRTDAHAPEASAWCARGAIAAATTDDRCVDLAEALLTRVTGWRDLAIWNDYPGRTHAHILAGFDAAIALAAQREGAR